MAQPGPTFRPENSPPPSVRQCRVAALPPLQWPPPPTLPYLLSSSYTPFLSTHLLFPPIRCTGSIHLTPPATLDPHPDNGPSTMSPPTPTHLSVCLPSPRAPSTGFPSVPLPHPYTAPTCIPLPSIRLPYTSMQSVLPRCLPADLLRRLSMLPSFLSLLLPHSFSSHYTSLPPGALLPPSPPDRRPSPHTLTPFTAAVLTRVMRLGLESLFL